MDDTLVSSYWLVNRGKLDESPVASIAANGDGTYTITFNATRDTATAEVRADGTLSVARGFVLAVPTANGDKTLEPCEGARIGKHILWDTGEIGEHWVR